MKYPGVRARWSGRLGWTFRAVVDVRGARKVGPQRLTQEDASQDYRRMRVEGDSMPINILTLDEALARVAFEARERGVPEPTVVKHYECHGRYLLRFWRPTTRLTQLTRSEVMWFVREARAAGRSPNTLIGKDLPLLAKCFEAAGLKSIVAEVREELRQTLKRIPAEMTYLEPEELADVLLRMREGVWRRVELRCPGCRHTWVGDVEDRAGDLRQHCPRKACGRRFTVRSRRRGRVAVFRSREVDADLVELLTLTGVRSGELGRVRIADFDPKRMRIRVVSKDRGHPRHIDVVGRLEAIVGRLVDAARERAGWGEGAERALLVPDSMNHITNICRRWKVRLGEPRLSGRTLRHSFVTGLLYSGAASAQAKGLAGHRHLSTTDRYTHEISRHRAELMERWQRRLGLDPHPNPDPDRDGDRDGPEERPPAGERDGEREAGG